LDRDVRFPRDLDELKLLGRILDQQREQHPVCLSIAFISIYIFLQTFAIPGSIMLSILAGTLFNVSLGLFYVCLSTALGALFCFNLSKYFIGPLIEYYLDERIQRWQNQVNRHRHHLFNYMIFIRVTPILPNWFIHLIFIYLPGHFFGVHFLVSKNKIFFKKFIF
jgi:uncharacterized membrane protein YdjX (TVP38/TMEM64 family)